jgi:hypothetical protein
MCPSNTILFHDTPPIASVLCQTECVSELRYLGVDEVGMLPCDVDEFEAREVAVGCGVEDLAAGCSAAPVYKICVRVPINWNTL